MKSAVIVFPGSNRDRDMIAALEKISGQTPLAVWHGDAEIPPVDLIVIPGGFSYGDYLRSGAIAARAPIMPALKARAAAGVDVSCSRPRPPRAAKKSPAIRPGNLWGKPSGANLR